MNGLTVSYWDVKTACDKSFVRVKYRPLFGEGARFMTQEAYAILVPHAKELVCATYVDAAVAIHFTNDILVADEMEALLGIKNMGGAV